MKKLVVLLSFLTLSLTPLFAQDQLTNFESKITGTWTWFHTETAGRSSGNWETPNGCNCTKKLVIQPNKKYQYFENSKLVYSGDFVLLMNGESNDGLKFLFVGNYFNSGIYLSQSGQLRMGSTSGCGDIFVYSR